VMGIKECTCDEHQVMYGSVESLYYTPETNITLYVNWNLNKNVKRRKEGGRKERRNKGRKRNKARKKK